jgi:hypothetical protein
MPEEAARPRAGRRAAAKHPRETDSLRRRRLSLVEQEWGVRNVGPRTSANPHAGEERRTVVIRGQVADRYTTGTRPARRGSRSRSSSYGPLMRPDRAALWAVLLGVALVIVALVSAHM